ncbi:MAG: AraC family transcriptional regulator [Clostridia bacterium]|nr:AraC family transcriptional regulator [Clostridia bacterium]
MELIYFSSSEKTDFHPLLVGHYVCPSNNTFGPHVRDYHLIHMVLRGKGTIYNDRGAHAVSGGELFIIREGEVTTYVADKDDPWEYTWIGFTGSRVSLFNDAPDVFETPGDLDVKLCEYVKRDEKSIDIYLSILYELIYHLFSSQREEHQDERVREVHRFIKYNYMNNISVSSLASLFGFDRSYLYRIFKQRYGLSPKEYLTQVRLDKGKWLLSMGHSVAESAYIVGYPDAFSFSKAYKKRYGTPPSRDKLSAKD